MNARVPLVVFLVVITMLVVGLGKMPWSYYQILRIVVAAVSAWIAIVMFDVKKQTIGVLFVVIALAYNPFIPLRFGREAWEMINIATIVVFLIGFGLSRAIAGRPQTPH